MLKLDAMTMNFGTFVSGKLLGSTLELTNLTNREQIFHLCIDEKSQHYTMEQVFANVGRSDMDTIPFKKSDLAKEG